MTQTPLTQRQDIEYLVKTVLDAWNDDLLMNVLGQNNIYTIPTILNMRESQIDSMTYINSRGTVQRIPNYIDILFCTIIQWNQHLIATHNIVEVDWSDKEIVNAESYNNYRVSQYDPELPILDHRILPILYKPEVPILSHTILSHTVHSKPPASWLAKKQTRHQPPAVELNQTNLTQLENKDEQHEMEPSNQILINAKTSRVLPPSEFKMLLSSFDTTDHTNNTKPPLNTNSKLIINLHRITRTREVLFDQKEYGRHAGSVNRKHKCAHIPNDNTIHSCIQVDKSIKLHWRTPFEKLHGNTVYNKPYESRGGESFPSQSNEAAEKFVGFSEDVDHPMTYKVLTEATLKVLQRSRIKLASVDPQLHLDDPIQPTQQNATTNANPASTGQNATTFATQAQDLIGRIYLDLPEDGVRRRIRIIEQLDNSDNMLANKSNMIEFRATSDDGIIEETITYNQILENLVAEDGEEDEWHFKSILNHQGPLEPNDPDFKGSIWNVQILWENDKITWEPLRIIAAGDPLTCRIYAYNNRILHKWSCVRNSELSTLQKDKWIDFINRKRSSSRPSCPGTTIPKLSSD